MREFSLPRGNIPTPVGGLADIVFDRAEQDPHHVQLNRKTPDGWQEVTAARFRDEVLALAKGLLVSGVRFGDRVGIMSRTRYEWTLFDYALWSIGAEVVPLYPTSSAEQVRQILSDTQAVACVAENSDNVMTLGAVIGDLPQLTRLWEIEAGAVAELGEVGTQVEDAVVHRHRMAVTPESVATIAYTSGASGRARGCALTHRNLMTQADSMLEQNWLLLSDDQGRINASTLLFLPLAHIFGRTVQLMAFRCGAVLSHEPSTSASALVAGMAAVRPTFILAVPGVFERVLAVAQRKAESQGHGRLFHRAAEVAVAYGEAKERRVFDKGSGPGLALRMQHRVYDRLVYGRIRDVFGGRLRNAVSGGSPLDRNLGLFFDGAGITIHEGYGMTESSAGITCNPPGRVRFGSVGTPIGGARLAIADDGEIMLRSPQIAGHYLDHDGLRDVTAQDGWLHTGDLGSVDEHGYLTITGRKKDVIITSGGKSISPALLETRVRFHPLISQCVCVGDNRPFIAALITLDPDAVRHWLALQGRPAVDPAQLVADPDLETEIRRAVGSANARVSRAEAIRTFTVLPRQFTAADGLITHSLKLKRREITRMYARVIDQMYAREGRRRAAASEGRGTDR